MMGGGGMMGDWYGGGFVGWFGLLLMLLFWASIIVGIVLIVRAVSGQSRDREAGGYDRSYAPPQRRSSALEVLEERYARGEIDREEFLERKKDLGR